MKSCIYKNLAIRSLWLFVAAMALAIQPLSAQARSYKVVYSFTNDFAAGEHPSSSLVRDPKGNLYGIALGGTFSWGTVFKISATGHESVLYIFKGGRDGTDPTSISFRDSAGNLYGTVYQGGVNLFGTVFKLDTQGRITILYSFCPNGDCTKGAFPGSVIRGDNESLYGITYSGGNFSCAMTGCGTVFKIDRKGVQTVVHAFAGSGDGQNPRDGLVLDSSGNVYGTTSNGGVYGYGTVFKLSATGHESVKYSFQGEADGAYPDGGLYQDAEGNLYGTTSEGGAYNYGTVFKVTALGQFTVLYSFPGGASGANPYASLNLDQQGNIYGTTYSGGSQNFGTIFKLDASGNETVLHNFPKEGQAVHPSGLIIDASGNLYGTTYQGGKYNYGSVFELVP